MNFVRVIYTNTKAIQEMLDYWRYGPVTPFLILCKHVGKYLLHTSIHANILTIIYHYKQEKLRNKIKIFILDLPSILMSIMSKEVEKRKFLKEFSPYHKTKIAIFSQIFITQKKNIYTLWGLCTLKLQVDMKHLTIYTTERTGVFSRRSWRMLSFFCLLFVASKNVAVGENILDLLHSYMQGTKI